MGYEENCKRFEKLAKEVGAAEANRILEDDPFAGCVFSGWDGDYDETFTQVGEDERPENDEGREGL